MSETPSTIYRIDKGIPLPGDGRSKEPEIYTVARTMKVGDSILLPYVRNGLKGNLQRATGFQFVQRKVGSNMRIWRVK